ncbi:hypothetical protein AVEN_253101-1 [Araneus ventricosus]|uniref:Uncharacterized protein n=1 Tax=Araneus ventricosus TaxID=182803 RepID=A0A4Y2WAD0_ARAVE|nr:hypothetical protein AVEN_253101-1 [Araneus ventricosus]
MHRLRLGLKTVDSIAMRRGSPRRGEISFEKYRKDSSTFEIPYFVAKVGEPDVAAASHPILIPVKFSSQLKTHIAGKRLPMFVTVCFHIEPRVNTLLHFVYQEYFTEFPG